MFLFVSCSSGQSFSSFLQAIPWIITVIGWIVVRKDNDRRQARKDLRERLDVIEELVNDIDDAAIKYFSNAPSDTSDSLAHLIKSKLKKLAHQVVLVKKVYGDDYDVESLLIEFRRSVTSGDFDSAERVAIRETDTILQGIQDVGWELVSRLDGAYDQPKRKWHSGFIAWFNSLKSAS